MNALIDGLIDEHSYCWRQIKDADTLNHTQTYRSITLVSDHVWLECIPRNALAVPLLADTLIWGMIIDNRRQACGGKELTQVTAGDAAVSQDPFCAAQI